MTAVLESDGVPEWNPVPTGESRARVFRSDDGALVAKSVDPSGIDDLREERRRIEWLAHTGIPGPSVVDWSESERGARLLMTAVPGVPASELDSGMLLRAWPAVVGVLGRLHELPAADCPFERTLATMFRIAEDVVRRDAVVPEFLAEDQQGQPHPELLADLRTQLDECLDQERADLVVCHGDACLPNFMVDPDTLACTGLVDLGRLGIADRHADLALLRANAAETWDGDDGIHADRLLSELYGPDHSRPGPAVVLPPPRPAHLVLAARPLRSAHLSVLSKTWGYLPHKIRMPSTSTADRDGERHHARPRLHRLHVARWGCGLARRWAG